MATIGVIGWGFVGQATGKGFAKNKKNKIFWYDKFQESSNTLDEVAAKSEFIFICVPTPMFSDQSGCDMSIVTSVIAEIAPKIATTKKILIVKSSVLPGTVASYIKKYPKTNFAMNPEFLTQANSEKDFLNPKRTVVGSNKKDVLERIKKLYGTILEKSQPYFLVDTTTAELIKFMSNMVLASKIVLANEFYFLSKSLGADYQTVRKAVEVDPRIGTHLSVPGGDGEFGFGGMCFPKDMLGLLSLARKKKVDMSVLEAVWKKNNKIRKNKDWEKSNGVSDQKRARV